MLLGKHLKGSKISCNLKFSSPFDIDLYIFPFCLLYRVLEIQNCRVCIPRCTVLRGSEAGRIYRRWNGDHIEMGWGMAKSREQRIGSGQIGERRRGIASIENSP
jgi:hypothetical protein